MDELKQEPQPSLSTEIVEGVPLSQYEGAMELIGKYESLVKQALADHEVLKNRVIELQTFMQLIQMNPQKAAVLAKAALEGPPQPETQTLAEPQEEPPKE